MKVMVLGSDGQVGRELLRMRWPSTTRVVGVGHRELDIGSRMSVLQTCREVSPDVIVNAAAYTAVDRAEDERELAFRTNGEGPGYLAEAAALTNATIVHLSTDYVFDGRARHPYREDAAVNPLNVYGASKAFGEERVRAATDKHIILRTSWVFSATGQNFVKTILRLAQERPELRIVDDQFGCPTAASEISRCICLLVPEIAAERATCGTFHMACPGETSWFEFARAIVALADPGGGKRPAVRGIGTGEYPTKAARPSYSVLDCTLLEATYGIRLRPWRQALPEVVEECRRSAGGAATRRIPGDA